MGKVIKYQKIHEMEPREGLKYSTKYLKQTLEQRQELVKHVKLVLEEISDAIEGDQELFEWVMTPLKGFPRQHQQNRSLKDIIADMTIEAKGKRKNGVPKDFALAPIERWNKIFKDTDYEIELVQTFSPNPNNFLDLVNIE